MLRTEEDKMQLNRVINVLYDKHDVYKLGKLTKGQTKEMIKELLAAHDQSFEVTDHQYKVLYKSIDKNGDEEITKEEFLVYCQ